MQNKKLHVFIVLAYWANGCSKVDDVYFSRRAARARVIRLEDAQEENIEGVTFHIIRKTVKGMEHVITINNGKIELYKVQTNN